MSHIPLENLSVYSMSREISSIVWNIYELVDKTLQWSIGSQWIHAVDSIGANIAEGYGRYHINDKKDFIISHEHHSLNQNTGKIMKYFYNISKVTLTF